jgi:catechol 2,3-dioxygenase-like lactoylglutathione lyase family enzyme
MLTGIDHVVIVVPDLDRAVKSYQDLGFTVVRGGRHPTGTHNALIGFADGAYLELVAYYDPGATGRWRSLLDQGGGLIDYCLATDDLAGDTSAFRRAGVAIGDPWPLSRTRPDGYVLYWVLATPPAPLAGAAPFLIQDGTPRTERVPKETVHRNHVIGVATLTVAVDDLATLRRCWEGVMSRPAQEIRRDDLGAGGVRVTIGPHVLDVVSPTSAASPLTSFLATRGACPYAATLRTSGAKQALDVNTALGARLALV